MVYDDWLSIILWAEHSVAWFCGQSETDTLVSVPCTVSTPFLVVCVTLSILGLVRLIWGKGCIFQ
jgi:hypothetical protein